MLLGYAMEDLVHTTPRMGRDAFVGRTAELSRLAALDADGARLVTLVGPPGVGKSRLAWRHATRIGERGRNVVPCSLASVTEGDAVLRTLGQALGLPPLPEEDRLDRAVGALTDEGPSLLFLDGFERVLGATAELVAGLLDAVPDLRVVAAAREPLRLDGEVRLRIDSLPPDDGIELFRIRAEAHGAEPASFGDRRALHELVRRLDGMPLAIELAAARATVLSPSDILARLERRFQLLRGDARATTDSRQPTLEAAIDASWELLGPAEQATLAQCAVFPDAFTAEAAEAVVRLDDGDAEILDVLQSLQERSLLRSIAAVDETGARTARLALYESIRQYAAEKLEAEGDAAAARDRHARYYAAMADALTAASSTARREAVLANLSVDEAHFVQAFGQTADAPDRARLAIALAILHEVWGPRSRQLAITEVAVKAAEEAFAPALLGAALQLRGHALLELGRFPEAVRHFERAVDLAREAGDGPTERFAETGLALVAKREARFDEAERRCVRVLEAAGEDEAVRGPAISCLAFCLVLDGRNDEARRWSQRELDVARRSAGQQHEAACLVGLAFSEHAAGEVDASRAHYEEGLELLRVVGPHFELLNALLLKSWLETEAGALDLAEAHVEAAIAEQRHLADATMSAWAQSAQGLVRLMACRWADAAESFEQALSHTYSWRLVGSQALPLRVMALAGAGRLEEAEALHSEVQAQMGERIAPLGGLAEVAAGSVALCRARAGGDAEAAAPHLEVARACIAGASGNRAEPRTAARILERDLARTEAILAGEPVPPAAARTPSEATLPRPGVEAGADETVRPAEPQAPEAAVPPVDAAPDADDKNALLLEDEGRRFKPPGRRRWVDLGRRGAVKRILVRLVEARSAGEGPLSVDDLLAAGWPGEQVGYEAGVARVYSAVRTLRKLGLGAALETVDGGYRIAPAVPVRQGLSPA